MKCVSARIIFALSISMQVFAINFDQEIRPQIEGRWIGLGVDITTNQLPNKELALMAKLVAYGALGYVHKPAQKSVKNVAVHQLVVISLTYDIFNNDKFKKACQVTDKSLVPLEQRFVQELLATGIDDIATPYAIEALEERGVSTSYAYVVTGATKLLARHILSLCSLEARQPYMYTGNALSDIGYALYYFAYPKKQVVQQDTSSIDRYSSSIVLTTKDRSYIE